MGGRHDGWDRMADLTVPTLLLTGDESPMWFAERTDEAAARLQNGRGERVRGGHFFPMENPGETLDRVLAFLNEDV
jgi:pimeloyl-ACP methyl ester carboxylesterase